jgi:hypothetical protein
MAAFFARLLTTVRFRFLGGVFAAAPSPRMDAGSGNIAIRCASIASLTGGSGGGGGGGSLAAEEKASDGRVGGCSISKSRVVFLTSKLIPFELLPTRSKFLTLEVFSGGI